MNITPAAINYLKRLMERLSAKPVGLRFDGSVGSCRNSIPLLKPVVEKPDGFMEYQVDSITFFIPPEYQQVFETAKLDYETGLFSKGLNLTWPHREGGCPNCNQHH